jgi:hypothetical protein
MLDGKVLENKNAHEKIDTEEGGIGGRNLSDRISRVIRRAVIALYLRRQRGGVTCHGR